MVIRDTYVGELIDELVRTIEKGKWFHAEGQVSRLAKLIKAVEGPWPAARDYIERLREAKQLRQLIPFSVMADSIIKLLEAKRVPIELRIIKAGEGASENESPTSIAA